MIRMDFNKEIERLDSWLSFALNPLDKGLQVLTRRKVILMLIQSANNIDILYMLKHYTIGQVMF
jgi:hypothetical protein